MTAISNFCEYFTDYRTEEEVLMNYYTVKPQEGTEELKKYQALKGTIQDAQYQKNQLILAIFSESLALFCLSIERFRFRPQEFYNRCFWVLAITYAIEIIYRVTKITSYYFQLPEKVNFENPQAAAAQKA